MKKEIMFAFILMMCFSSALALETNIKNSYKLGETLIMSVSGNFLEKISSDSVKFYSGRLYVPMETGVSKIGTTYYIYSVLPDKEANYTLIIENVKYKELDKEISKDLKFNISVSGNYTDFSISPGVVVSNKDFNIKIKTKLNPAKIKYSSNSNSQEISLNADTERVISFSANNFPKNLSILNFESGSTKYSVPVYITNSSSYNEDSVLLFSEKEYSFFALAEEYFQFEINVINNGWSNLTNITITQENLDNLVNISDNFIFSLSPKTSKKIILTVYSEDEKVTSGKIIAKSGNLSYSSMVNLNVTEDKKEFQEIINQTQGTQLLSCVEMNGNICKSEESCDSLSQNRYSSDGICCLGKCTTQTKPSSSKTIIILVSLIVLGVIGFFVYKKMKTNRISAKNILKKTENEYEERFKPKETSGNLSRN